MAFPQKTQNINLFYLLNPCLSLFPYLILIFLNKLTFFGLFANACSFSGQALSGTLAAKFQSHIAPKTKELFFGSFSQGSASDLEMLQEGESV